ncbi:unnamed protein product [Nyctereutes procyonoides]|uniref:(raccoon dog) hypothetical protein n=1 Tax=Nyctereutes procyonoides TaxID=34880 RepID=A0A811Y8N5_NYCPR|nr:unnamed protein product [Nyctereutes procyonoides]
MAGGRGQGWGVYYYSSEWAGFVSPLAASRPPPPPPPPKENETYPPPPPPAPRNLQTCFYAGILGCLSRRPVARGPALLDRAPACNSLPEPPPAPLRAAPAPRARAAP